MSGCGDIPGQADCRPISVGEKVNEADILCVLLLLNYFLSNQNGTADSFIRPCVFKMDEKGEEEMM